MLIVVIDGFTEAFVAGMFYAIKWNAPAGKQPEHQDLDSAVTMRLLLWLGVFPALPVEPIL